MPSDGLPHMSYWQNNASDIYNIGFEAHREALEVTPRQNAPKDAMAKYIVTKGLGRVSIVMFGLAWTFLNIAQNMTEEVEKDFIGREGELLWLVYDRLLASGVGSIRNVQKV